MKKKMYQPYYLITYSPWPLLMSINLFMLMISIINWLYNKNMMLFIINLLILLTSLYQWFRDLIRESYYQGLYTINIIKNLKFGMIMFIISELLFFISFFWCYFHSFLSPNIQIGSMWPPMNIIPFNPYYMPLLNTIILLTSGITITLSHYYMINNNLKYSMYNLFYTILLGIIFTFCQYIEYMESYFSINDSIYGSIFFMGTGFHGLHVIIGSLFLLVNLIRMKMLNYSKLNHNGFEMSSWYWHFVDMIWLFLYLLFYYWSF